MRNHFLTPLIEHVYKEELPSVNPMVKSSIDQESATYARIADMQLKALMQGYNITLHHHRNDPKAEKLFEEPYREPKKDLPVIKRNELKPLNREKE